MFFAAKIVAAKSLTLGFSRQIFLFLNAKSSSTPSLLLFPAPLAAGALFLGAEIEFLDVL